MKITPVRALCLAGACCAFVFSARAQVVELRATINQAQEVPATGSPATGSAIMLYDVATNTFDLIVSISGMANTASASHIHEAAAGVNGPVRTDLGPEARYTRTGNTLTATFRGLTYGGDRLRLLRGESYYNIHSAQFPGGEVRGQMIPRPVRLYAVMDVAQEAAAMPAQAQALSALSDFGGAVMFYDPVTHSVRLRMSLFNFNNTFNNSHFHAEIPGRNGPVVTNLGTNPNAGGYNTANGHIAGSFDIPMGNADQISLLLGGLYLNFHSTQFPGGELRGQVFVSNELAGTRFSNLSVRGFVGTGDQVLIQGITISGREPIRLLISAKGPSLSSAGIAAPLANPRLTLHDAAGRQIAFNDDVGAVAAGSELASIPGVPANSVESALVVVLPPGNYTAIVSAASGSGIALLEASDLRTLNPGFVPGSTSTPVVASIGELDAAAALASIGRANAAPLEICAAPVVIAGR